MTCARGHTEGKIWKRNNLIWPLEFYQERLEKCLRQATSRVRPWVSHHKSHKDICISRPLSRCFSRCHWLPLPVSSGYTHHSESYIAHISLALPLSRYEVKQPRQEQLQQSAQTRCTRGRFNSSVYIHTFKQSINTRVHKYCTTVWYFVMFPVSPFSPN